ncbi:hypothetical protein Pcinc_000187 [Petrolisthes cinctipes]|uniref:Uncharacterized protein n=1 Tax=Petrolisthes cinctipes TaxID=88211 RepID=A0AAE1L510_PETCI|nr:hypothetical protein Pcinc_000187 [Petrolisthes cinctipes]
MTTLINGINQEKRMRQRTLLARHYTHTASKLYTNVGFKGICSKLHKGGKYEKTADSLCKCWEAVTEEAAVDWIMRRRDNILNHCDEEEEKEKGSIKFLKHHRIALQKKWKATKTNLA